LQGLSVFSAISETTSPFPPENCSMFYVLRSKLEPEKLKERGERDKPAHGSWQNIPERERRKGKGER